MPKPIENGQKPLENVFRTPTDCRFWETTAIATHENKERLMYSKGLLLNQIEQMRSYRTFPLVGPGKDCAATCGTTCPRRPLFFPVVDMLGSFGEEPKISSRTENL